MKAIQILLQAPDLVFFVIGFSLALIGQFENSEELNIAALIFFAIAALGLTFRAIKGLINWIKG